MGVVVLHICHEVVAVPRRGLFFRIFRIFRDFCGMFPRRGVFPAKKLRFSVQNYIFRSKNTFFKNWDDSGGPKSQKTYKLLSFFDDLELIPGIRGIPGIPGSCPQTPLRDLPSTRAGGQDDVSSTQTPSNEGTHFRIPWAF